MRVADACFHKDGLALELLREVIRLVPPEARRLSRLTSTEVRKLKAPGGPGASRGVFRGVVAGWWWPGIPLGKPPGPRVP